MVSDRRLPSCEDEAPASLSPPSPPLPPAAQSLRWMTQPYEFLRECARTLGDLFKLDLGVQQGKYIIISNPEAIRRVFTADANALHVCNGVLQLLFGPGSLMLMEGERHVRERRLLLPSFQHKALVTYRDVIRDIVVDATRPWAVGHEFLASEFFQSLSVDVILRVIFGEDDSSTCLDLRRELVALLNDRRFGLAQLARVHDSAYDALEGFWKQFARVRHLTREVVRARRSSPEGSGDMVAVLLGATDENGVPRSDDEVRDEALTLVVTGHETTATSLAWALYWLGKDKRVEGRILDELASNGERGGVPPATLTYLDATCMEVLRICPIVPASFRQVVGQPFELDKYVFEPGTILSPNIYLTHRRPDLYPDPDRFEPDRFLRRKYSPYEYLPFGGGARRCIGMNLALYEMRVVLETVLSRYELEILAPETTGPVRRFITIAPSGGPRVVVRGLRS